MNTTSRRCIHVLAIAALVACGGSGPGANGPAGAGPSKISAKFESPDHKLDVTGPAFAIVNTYEKTALQAEETSLGVYVFDASTDPPPTCEMLSKVGALQQLSRGGFVAFTMAKIAEGPGKVDVTNVTALMGSGKGDLFFSGGKVTNMSITLRSYDKTFTGDVTTAGGAGTTASGTIAGTVCPPATIADPNAAGAAGGGKVEDPSAGMSTNDTAGMPPPPEPPPPEPPPATKPKTKPKPKPKPKTPKPPK
jgi:hypothetical protein